MSSEHITSNERANPALDLAWQTYLHNWAPLSSREYDVARAAFVAAWHARAVPETCDSHTEARWLLSHAISRETRHEWTHRRDVFLGTPCMICGSAEKWPALKASERPTSADVLTRICPGCNTVHSGPLCPTENGDER
jgi:hypothetical protein